MSKKKTTVSATVAMDLLNICVLLCTQGILLQSGNWVYSAILCVLMLVERGVMGFHFAKSREAGKEKQD